MFGWDKGFKCPNLPWTAPGFQVIKGIIYAPSAKPARRPESRDALLTAIAKARDGSTTSGSAAFRHEQEWPAFFWSAERRGASSVVGYGRSVVRYLVSRICRNHRSLRKAEVGPRGCLNAPGPVVRLSHVCLPHNANRRYPYAPSPSLS